MKWSKGGDQPPPGDVLARESKPDSGPDQASPDQRSPGRASPDRAVAAEEAPALDQASASDPTPAPDHAAAGDQASGSNPAPVSGQPGSNSTGSDSTGSNSTGSNSTGSDPTASGRAGGAVGGGLFAGVWGSVDEMLADAGVEEEAESGFALVEGISDESKMIARAEAQRLEGIARLYALDEMRPLPPPLGAQASARRRAREVAALTREDVTVREVAARLSLSEYAARRLVRLALTLTTRFRGTLAALSAGRLDLRRAEIVEEHAGPLVEDHYQAALAQGESPAAAERAAVRIAEMVESLVLGKATTSSPDRLHPLVRRVVHRLDPDFAERQVKRELKGRHVTHRTNPGEGTGDVYAHLGAAEAQGVYNVVDSYARAARQAGSERNLNELRADALTHLVLYGHMPEPSAVLNPVPVDTDGASVVAEVDPNTGDIRRDQPPDETSRDETSRDETSRDETSRDEAGSDDASQDHATGAGSPSGASGPPRWAGSSRSGLRTHVQIVVGLETLLGLNNEPADLAGHGPITAQAARDLAFASGSTWRRLVTDPITGYLLDYGRKTYRPPVALADHVRARDVVCRTPNCTRPASKCQLDHVISWPAGTTSEQNLATECDRDHRMKHEGGWRHQVSTDPQHPPGTIILISPTGHVYLSYPHVYDPPPKSQPDQANSTVAGSMLAGTHDSAGVGSDSSAGGEPGASAIGGSGAPNPEEDSGEPPF